MKSVLSNKLKIMTVATLLAFTGLVATPIAIASVNANPGVSYATLADEADSALEAIGGSTGGNEAEVNSTVKNVINILLFVIGVASVIMLLYGAIRFVVSAGDPQGISAARNTIIYAIIGVVVASMAYTLVNWVLDRVDNGATSSQEADFGEEGQIPEGSSDPAPDVGDNPPSGDTSPVVNPPGDGGQL